MVIKWILLLVNTRGWVQHTWANMGIDGDNKDFRQVWLTLIKRKEQANVNEDDSSDAWKANKNNSNSIANECREKREEMRQKDIMKIMESVYDIKQQSDIILAQLHGLMDEWFVVA